MNSFRNPIVWFLFTFLWTTLAAAGGFQVRFAGQQTVDGENALAVTFSMALDPKQDLSPYLTLMTDDGSAVEGEWMLAEDPSKVYFTHVEPDTAYQIHVTRGVKSESGETLAEDTRYEITTRRAEPMISFGSRGFVLASKLVRGLPVDSLNIAQADIDFFRIRPGMQAEFKKNFWSSDRLYYYQSRDLGKVADLVYSGRWDLDVRKDQRTQVNIPVTHIEALKVPGIYFAVLKGAGLYEYGYNSTWFTISDLGLHGRVYDRNIRFHVQSLATAAPVQAARIEGFDKEGRSLFAMDTDSRGQAVARGRFETLSLVSVARGDDITLMPMDVPSLDLSEFTMGQAPYRPVDLFVYGPRDIYRPGETVFMDGILRNQDGGMTPGVPIQARVVQPDGRTIREFSWRPGPQNHFHGSFPLPANALTGRWRVEFTHGAGRLKPYPFVVSEFLPERMKLDIGEDERSILRPDSPLDIPLQGDFLYGAPAAGSRADALVHIRPARELFEDQWPGFAFGDVKNLMNTSFSTEEIRLDDTGIGVIPVENQWQGLSSPHWVTANVSLYDSGGRPVVRNRSWQVWPAPALVGIRNLSGSKEDPGQVPNDSTAEFEVILADAEGRLSGAAGLEATVIREHREYYWEFKNNEWHWGSTSHYYPVDRFTLDIEAGGRTRARFPVKWGGYRLEIANPDTGLTSAYEIWAGWRPEARGQGAMNRPDRVDLTLDKPAYRAGDRAVVTVKAPQGGQGYLFVDGSENLLTLPISLPAGGNAFEITVEPSWTRHDLYVSALVIRPGEGRTSHLPKRSVGLVPLVLDRSQRQLAVTIDAPEKSEPNQAMDVAVQLKTADGRAPSNAWVTLAAVDVGILNLTGFETPSPHDYFFQNRAYSPQLHDIYQRLIEAAEGTYARQRFGGDAPTLTRGGDRPATDVQIVSLFHRAVETDDGGRARFRLDIPDFDGRLRLMAVAHTADAFGSGDREMTLASPLVVQATMPRFLAAGDKSQIMLDIRNMTDTDQSVVLETEATGPLTVEGDAPRAVSLAPGAKTLVRLPVSAGMTPGRTEIRCRVKGIQTETGARELVKTWALESRYPSPPATRNWKRSLAPGETMTVPSRDLDALVADTVAVRAGLDTEPPVNLAHHVSRLLAYPYGCLEQTVSGLFPHVLLSESDFADIGVKTSAGAEKIQAVNLGIQRLLEKQKSSGGFGLWDSKSPESAWVTAYAVHFLINAHEAGFEVPLSGMEKAVKRLLVYVRQPNRIPYAGYVKANACRAAARAYAAFVLARVQSLSLGDARGVFAYVKTHARGPLSLVQAGVALSLAGDRQRASEAFDLAIKTGRNEKFYVGDYGSDVRDFAAAYYYLTVYSPAYKYRALFLHELDAALAGREWLSTQERNALVMAGAARRAAPGRSWAAEVSVGGRTGSYDGDRPGQVIFTRGSAAGGFVVRNTGDSDLYVDLVLTGYPNAMPGPSTRSVTVQRRFLDAKGQPVDIARAVTGDRIIVEIRVKPEKRMPHALVVDMVPAGVELEDPNVSGAFLIDDVVVDKKPVRDWHGMYTTAHTEYRDDRFVAALDVRQTCRIFYPVRVVSPGSFKVPPTLVEDMYRPGVRAVGATIPRMEVTGP